MEEYIGLCDQQNHRIVVYNVQNLTEPVWEWTCEDARFRSHASGLKCRRHPQYGPVLLVCTSGGYVAMITCPGGEVVWQTTADGNVHSVELLPNGNVAIAASDGNYIRVYQTPETYVERYLQQAHGVLYDPERHSLWGLGKTTLSEYDPDTLARKGNVCDFSGVDRNGHDLSPYYGDPDRLWFTAKQSVFIYQKSTNVASVYEPIATGHVKGIGNTPFTNTVFYVSPNGTYRSWCSNVFYYIDETGHHAVPSDTDAYYKLRVLYEPYQ